MEALQNANPTVYKRLKDRMITNEEEDENLHDKIDSREIFDILFLYCFILFFFSSKVTKPEWGGGGGGGR